MDELTAGGGDPFEYREGGLCQRLQTRSLSLPNGRLSAGTLLKAASPEPAQFLKLRKKFMPF